MIYLIWIVLGALGYLIYFWKWYRKNKKMPDIKNWKHHVFIFILATFVFGAITFCGSILEEDPFD